MNLSTQSRARWICPRCGLMNRGVNRCRSCSYEYKAEQEEASSPLAKREAPEQANTEPSTANSAEQPTATEQVARSARASASAAAQLSFCELCDQTALRALGGDGLLWQCDACDQLVWMGKESHITSSGFRKAIKSSSSQNLGLRKRRKQKEGWGRLWELASSYGFVLSMAAMALIAGLIFITLRSIQHEQQSAQRNKAPAETVLTNALAQKAPWARTQKSLNRVQQYAMAYARATRPEEIAQLVIDGQQMEERIRDWLLNTEDNRPMSAAALQGIMLSLDENQVEQINGNWWRLVMTGQTAEKTTYKREIVMEITEESLRIDWPASAGIGEVTWEELLLERSQLKGKIMRVFVEPARPPSNSIIPYIAQELDAHPLYIYPTDEGKQPLVSYISKGSILEGALRRRGVQLGTQDEEGRPLTNIQPKRLILLLTFPPEAETQGDKTPRVTIKRILRNNWLSYANPILSEPEQAETEGENEEQEEAGDSQ